jgi:hypothetical protein
MPMMSGLEAVRHIKTKSPMTKIIVPLIYTNLKVEAMATGLPESTQPAGFFVSPFSKTTPKTYLSIGDNSQGLLLISEHEFNLIHSEGLVG